MLNRPENTDVKAAS